MQAAHGLSRLPLGEGEITWPGAMGSARLHPSYGSTSYNPPRIGGAARVERQKASPTPCSASRTISTE
jgi:hypothetical protein